MRNINECKVEIFRLSEKRIAERKRKLRRTAAFCIPLCLFLTVFSATALPKMISTSQSVLPSGTSEQITEKAPVTSVLGSENTTDTTPPKIEADEDSDPLYGAQDFPLSDPSTSTGSPEYPVGGDNPGTILPTNSTVPADFSFSLTWGTHGISSYDSVSGVLVKTTDASAPEDYVTTYRLDADEREKIYNIIKELNVTSYPDTYDPQYGELGSDPSMTLILWVKMSSVEKTVTAKDIALTFETENAEGQRFLTACREIINILTSTEEWKALPEYEFYYY